MGEHRVVVFAFALWMTISKYSAKAPHPPFGHLPPGGEGSVGCRFVGKADLPLVRPPSPALAGLPGTNDPVGRILPLSLFRTVACAGRRNRACDSRDSQVTYK